MPQSHIIEQRPAFLDAREELWAQFQEGNEGKWVEDPHQRYLFDRGTSANITPSLGETHAAEKNGDMKYIVEGTVILPSARLLELTRALRLKFRKRPVSVQTSFTEETSGISLGSLQPDQRIAVLQFVYATRLERLDREYEQRRVCPDGVMYGSLVRLNRRIERLARQYNRIIGTKCRV